MARWTKGQSGNPGGRPPGNVSKAKGALGYDGVVAYGGVINLGEGDSDLTGTQRWKTIANMYRRPPVAVWARLRAALLAGVTWTVTENPAGGADAARGKEIVEEGLLRARLGRGASVRSFSQVAARAIQGAAAVGFSLHATQIARRKRDGMVVYTDIANRPADTITKWHREREGDETTPFVAVQQETKTGRTIRIPLDEALYVVNDNGTGSESPLGVGMLLLIAERVRKLGVYESLEGSEFISSLGGIPIIRAPIAEMKESLKSEVKGPNAATKIASAVVEKLRPFRDFVAKRFKDPTKLPWFELDSATYQGSDPNSISGIKKWDIEVIKGELQGLAEARTINKDYDLDIARMLGVEHVWMGGGDTAGTYAAHDSKITALGAATNAEVGAFAFVVDHQLCRPLVAANNLDPDTAAPIVTPSPVMRADVLRAVDAIVKVQMASLPPNHPAKKAVFEGVDLPWEDEDESLMLPRQPPALPPGQQPPAGDPPDDVPDREDDPPKDAPPVDPREEPKA